LGSEVDEKEWLGALIEEDALELYGKLTDAPDAVKLGDVFNCYVVRPRGERPDWLVGRHYDVHPAELLLAEGSKHMRWTVISVSALLLVSLCITSGAVSQTS